MRVTQSGEVVCDVPVKALTDEAPVYERPMKQVSSFEFQVSSSLGAASAAATEISTAAESEAETNSKLETRNSKLNEALLRLLSSPNLASKEWVYRQYDHMVRTNTAVLPGGDAAVVRIKETRRGLAIALDGNGRYCAVNPREGAKLVVAEAARNVVCVGAQPIAITNCLNFASPERPEVMWSFSEVIDGLAEACAAFNTPVVSGNVSFYNETEGRGILPTPVIGMVGLIDDVRKVIQPGFKQVGDLIALLGTTRDDLSVSEYKAVLEGATTEQFIASGKTPQLDLELEKAVQSACLRAAEAGLLRSAHDCSDGGLAVALAECCFSSHGRAAAGAGVDVTGEYDVVTRLFGETPSRIIISFDPSLLGRIEEIVATANCPMTMLGAVEADVLRMQSDGEEVIRLETARMEDVWRSSFKQRLQAEAVAAGAE